MTDGWRAVLGIGVKCILNPVLNGEFRYGHLGHACKERMVIDVGFLGSGNAMEVKSGGCGRWSGSSARGVIEGVVKNPYTP